jgi:hypothetical protein
MSASARLESSTAQAVFLAQLLSCAIHDPGPWTVAVDGVEAPAGRAFTDDSVTFFADFHRPVAGVAELRLAGEPVSYLPVESPVPFELTWTLTLTAQATV